jgi:hypothetical protein
MPDLNALPAGSEPIRIWNPFTGEWEGIAVPVTPVPERRRTARRTARRTGRRVGRPVNRDDLSDGSPLPYLADTAYAPGEPLADMRTLRRSEPVIKTHRAAVIAFAADTAPATSARWHDLGR